MGSEMCIRDRTAGLRQLAKEGGKSDVSKMAAILGLTEFDDERDEGTTLQ